MGKLIPRELECAVVGLQHRLTPSSQKMLERRVKKEVIALRLKREPDNMYDDNAIKVIISEGRLKDMHIGYIPRTVAAVLAPAFDDGDIKDWKATLTDIDIHDGSGTMLMEFKAAVRVRVSGRK